MFSTYSMLVYILTQDMSLAIAFAAFFLKLSKIYY
jgi:hypothetical protein